MIAMGVFRLLWVCDTQDSSNKRAFLEALYSTEAEFNRPLVLIMEEAHVLVPEVGRVRLPSLKKAQDKVVYWTYEASQYRKRSFTHQPLRYSLLVVKQVYCGL